jgi:hypothetical protein
MSDQMRKAFEVYRDERNAALDWEGHKPGSKWHVDNTHYITWQASRASLIVVAPKYDIPEISAKESIEMDPDEYEAQENLAGVIDYVARQYREAITKTGVRVK